MLFQRTAKYKSASTLGSRRFSLAACFMLSSPARTVALQQGLCANEATRIVINAAAGSLDATMGICKNFSLLRIAFPPSLSTHDISNSTVTFTGGIDGTFTITSETTDGRLVAVLQRSGGSIAPNHTAGDAATAVEFTLHNLKNISAPVPYNYYRENFTDFTYTINRQCTAPPLTGPCLPPAPVAPCLPPKLSDTTIFEAKVAWLANETAAALKYCHIKDWDVSEVTTMNSLFKRASTFNGDVSSWDVSKVTHMKSMFQQASTFNGDVSSWDVSKVTDTGNMFFRASAFNGNLSSWDVSKVTTMRTMFSEASAFNGDLSSWNVSKVASGSSQQGFDSSSGFKGTPPSFST